jgi:hypothetical protein
MMGPGFPPLGPRYGPGGPRGPPMRMPMMGPGGEPFNGHPGKKLNINYYLFNFMLQIFEDKLTSILFIIAGDGDFFHMQGKKKKIRNISMKKKYSTLVDLTITTQIEIIASYSKII